ncbi:D-serine deaminase-like pyridoxal phosphate-dependent protein [Archangium gephyra]|uniref:D-serine deaminase-like pyridoxal phosphate-dependent protein n=1 Tax=Archangium gephyra TaxID=48 RepID=A0AAC8TIJ2_9BACT|nr:D-TA family PLP-dependent enzyme [Archangium gephyra]AKJ07437.1 low-specificity D-threonine aldolase [Archangium gephyra]REG26833.1 D-serine deaminase-like pyridoxal phosphate-dependent protein [Archangium gephyra]
MSLPSLDSIETPAALVDEDRLETNLQRAAAYVREHGLRWRPHTKTHKVPELAARQLQAGASGVTVATPREAEVMGAVADDVLLAYSPVGASKLARLMALPGRVRLSVAVDSREVLAGLAEAARGAGRRVGVLVELDLGMRRVGVPTPEEAVVLAREAAGTQGLEYQGVMFYPGHIRMPMAEQGPALAEVSRRLGTFLETLGAAGLKPGIVSGGSTPTLWRSHEVVGMNEIRPGITPFFDRASAWMGACGWDEVAYSVLATVVSTAVPGQAVIDAGSKALAKEELPVGGYGALLERPDVVVHALSEEHGMLDLSRTSWRPRVGERVRVVPNHVCVSVNLQDELWAVRGGQVVGRWDVTGRGRGPSSSRN